MNELLRANVVKLEPFFERGEIFGYGLREDEGDYVVLVDNEDEAVVARLRDALNAAVEPFHVEIVRTRTPVMVAGVSR
jgi:hypothetical protein